MTILFFSATGNCLSVAKSIGGELKSIPQLERAGEYETEDDVIGIISPVYNFTLPLLVRRYLSNAKLKADYIFGVMTYGNISGAAADMLVKALKANVNRIDYTAYLRMVDTYLPVFNMEKQIAGLPKKDVDTHLVGIKRDIENRVCKLQRRNLFWQAASAVWGNRAMESAKGINAINHTDEKFIINKKCNACGTCARVCPVSNINAEGKPIFRHHCESCLACIHNCPARAIQLIGQRSEARFRNGSVTLKELIRANGS
jgi:ferredoxin